MPYAYVHFKPDGTPFYAGKATRRLRAFDFRAGRNPHWKNIVNKYGAENIGVKVIEVQTEQEAFELEKLLIGELREKFTITNVTPGGGRPSGYTHSAEARRNMSLAHIGQRPTPEQIRKIVETRMRNGYTHSTKTRQKMAAAFRPERKQEMRMAMLGDKNFAKDPAIGSKISIAKTGKPRPDMKARMSGPESSNRRPEVRKKFSIAKRGRVWMRTAEQSRLVTKTVAEELALSGWYPGRIKWWTNKK